MSEPFDDQVYTRILSTLQTLQLPQMAAQLHTLTAQAAAENWSALTYLDHLTQAELHARVERDVQRKLRLAHFPLTSLTLPFSRRSMNASCATWPVCAS